MHKRNAMNNNATLPEASDRQDENDFGAEAFIRVVGERVKTARLNRGLSRRALAEGSAVSQRYLAQLESGQGNISIGLLKRVSTALDQPIEWLVGEAQPAQTQALRVAALFLAAPEEKRRRVLDILDPNPMRLQRGRRIALIGLRGAGKSTLGRLSAAALKIRFVELNREIESTSGMPVHELIALYGQEGYRRLERQALEKVAEAEEALVLAVAGGIVSEPDAFSLLLRRFHTIWLKAKPEEHMARVREQGDMRPMAGNPAAMEALKTILTTRESLYARAEIVIDTSGKSADESLSELLAAIEREGFLDA
jgi:XRE family transcriptional regulator, aerobic/anaerobic benzoate catabolism transcriptional regulator